MGWTFSHKRQGQTIKQFFEESGVFKGVDNHEFKLLKIKTINMRECYCAVYHKFPDGKEQVFGLVILIQYDRLSYHNFGWKEMEETSGPYYYNCPKDILNLLTDTDNEIALAWRKKCQETLNTPKLKSGDKIKFNNDISFTNGDKLKEFIVIKKGRKIRFQNPETKLMDKISGLNRMEYSLVG